MAALANARNLAANATVQNRSQATTLVIIVQAGDQIRRDWAQGDFQIAGHVAGTDCT